MSCQFSEKFCSFYDNVTIKYLSPLLLLLASSFKYLMYIKSLLFEINCILTKRLVYHNHILVVDYGDKFRSHEEADLRFLEVL